MDGTPPRDALLGKGEAFRFSFQCDGDPLESFKQRSDINCICNICFLTPLPPSLCTPWSR